MGSSGCWSRSSRSQWYDGNTYESPAAQCAIPLIHDDKPEWLRYTEEQPQRRQAFLLRRQVYDREMAQHREEPAVLIDVSFWTYLSDAQST